MKLHVNAKDFSAALRAILPFVSDDITRPNLCGVHVRPAQNGVELLATDGHTLCKMRHSCEVVSYEASTPEGIRRLRLTGDRIPVLLAELKGPGIAPGIAAVEVPLTDVAFPEVDQVIPRPEPELERMFDTKLLARLKPVQIVAGVRGGVLTFPDEEEGPLRVDFGPDATVVIMGMRKNLR